jgi:SAM-dependent methyltransferase
VLDYLEDLWDGLPEDAVAPDLGLRRAFLEREVHPQDTALDLGCGQGELTAVLAARGARAVGADVAEAALRRARARHPGLTFVRVPLDGPLPFADGEFSVIWASEVIEHVADTARWLTEARRVLAPSGRLLLTTPAHGRLRLLLGGIERYSEPLGDHLHLYSRRSLATVLGTLNFSAITIRTAGGAPGLRRLLLARAVR